MTCYNREIMYTLTQEVFQRLLDQAPLRPRVKREVRFMKSISQLSEDDWAETELLAISDKAGNRGVLVLQVHEAEVYLASYALSRGLVSSTGKAQPIICDFCRTWQTGSRSGSITLDKPGRDAGSITFLCCADLQCSRHVRNLTAAAKTSRSQLREDMTSEQRVERLKQRIEEVGALLGLTPLAL